MGARSTLADGWAPPSAGVCSKRIAPPLHRPGAQSWWHPSAALFGPSAPAHSLHRPSILSRGVWAEERAPGSRDCSPLVPLLFREAANPSMTTNLGVLTSVMAGLPVPAQAQAQDTQTQLVIRRVEVNYALSQMTIHGRNFATGSGVPPVVQFMGTGVGVVTYDASKVIISVPLAFLGAAFLPADDVDWPQRGTE